MPLDNAQKRYINGALTDKVGFWYNDSQPLHPFGTLSAVLRRLQAQGRPWPRSFEELSDLMLRFRTTPKSVTYNQRLDLLHNLDALTHEYNAMAFSDRAHPLHRGDPAIDTEDDDDKPPRPDDHGLRAGPPLVQAFPYDHRVPYADPVARASDRARPLHRGDPAIDTEDDKPPRPDHHHGFRAGPPLVQAFPYDDRVPYTGPVARAFPLPPFFQQ